MTSLECETEALKALSKARQSQTALDVASWLSVAQAWREAGLVGVPDFTVELDEESEPEEVTGEELRDQVLEAFLEGEEHARISIVMTKEGPSVIAVKIADQEATCYANTDSPAEAASEAMVILDELTQNG